MFGVDVRIFEEAAEAPLMTKYTGGVVHARTATWALSMDSGGGFEIWQYTSRNTVCWFPFLEFFDQVFYSYLDLLH
jgi:hypothetical protein